MRRPDLAFIRTLEEALFEGSVRRRPEAVATLLADDFLEFGRSGKVFTRAEVVRSLAAEAPQAWQRPTASNHRLTALADDVVLLTYRSTRNDSGTELHSLRSSIWKRIGGEWRMVFHQGTPATAEG